MKKYSLLYLSVLIGLAVSACVPSEIPDLRGIPMVLVPAGEFTMGSDTDGNPGNSAQRVYLDKFYIDKFEVTNADYENCVAAGICDPPHETKSEYRADYFGKEEFNRYPVVFIDWYMAKNYCESWREARLPTEAEWEKAARGPDGRSYPWGEGISCDRANYDGDPDFAVFCAGDTAAVGSYESGKSPYGVYDMAGNVFEWVSSLNKAYPYNAADGREDPIGGGSRVIRGGSWSQGPNDQQVFYCSWLGPNLSESVIGFRCAKDANP
jgi:formylglycine-generating enzyme required for sulfatase activity